MEKQNSLQLLSKYKGPIMGFAAWCIVLFHEWQPLFAGVPGLGIIEAAGKQIGFFGVDIFFLLSGLGLTYAIRKGKLLSFYWRRIKRLLIPVLVLGLLRLFTEHWTWTQFWENLSGYTFYTENIYAFLWFIPAICTLYFLFPFYYKLFERAGDKMAFTVAAIALWLGISLMGIIRYDAHGFTNRIPVFLIGILLGWMTQHKTVEFKKSTWGCMGVLLLLGYYLAYQTCNKGLYLVVPVSNCFLPTLLLAVSSAFLLAKGLDLISSTRFGRGIAKFFGFFGLFSLEFYCVQEWLGALLIPRLEGQVSTLLVNLLTLAAITAVSFVLYLFQKYSWKVLEKCKRSR